MTKQPGNVELLDALYLVKEHPVMYSPLSERLTSPGSGDAGLVSHEQLGESSVEASFCLSSEDQGVTGQDDRLKMENRILNPFDDISLATRAHDSMHEGLGSSSDAPSQDYHTTVSILEEAASIARERFDRLFEETPDLALDNPRTSSYSDSDQDGDFEAFSEDC